MIVAVGLMIYGMWLWSGLIGLRDVFLQSYGCILMILSFSFILFKVVFNKCGRIVWSVINALFFPAILLFAVAFVGGVPFMPSQPIYGLLSLPLMGICSASTVTEFIVTRKSGRKEEAFLIRIYEKFGKINNVTVKRIDKR